MNDTVTLSAGNCDWYIFFVRKHHPGSICVYDSQGIDIDSELSYEDCLYYRFMKSLGADSVCKDCTLVYTCSLFGFMKEWLQEGGVFMDSDIMSDTDTILQRENMFSDADCEPYYSIKSSTYSVCENNSMSYVTDPRWPYSFFRCITDHFMTEMRARNSCSDDSLGSDSNTMVKSTITLLSKDRLFYNFMVNTLDAGNVCQAMNDTVTLSAEDCDWYVFFIKKYPQRSRCLYNSQSIDIDGELSYTYCLYYRLMKSLGADSFCQVSLIKNCDWYYMIQSPAPTCICVFGLIGNLLSLYMFGSGAVETPIAYQLLWLAGVDITFILTWWVTEVLPEILRYYNEQHYLTLYQTNIMSVLTICLRPLAYVARSCTVWLTVLIGLYRYLAVCKPYNNLTCHCTLHGHKYVIVVVFLSFLYNIPYFCEYYIDYKYTHSMYVYNDWSQRDHYIDGWEGFYALRRTGFVSKELLDVYSRINTVGIVSLPCLILFFATVSILIELRKMKKKRSSMQTSQTSQNSITVMLVTILLTFIVCKLPYFLCYGFGGKIRNPDLDPLLGLSGEKILGCGTFMFYVRLLVDAGLLLNSSANGFIYFFLNKTRPSGKLSFLAASVEVITELRRLKWDQ